MVEMLFLLFISICFINILGSIEIVRGPVTVSNATIGGTVRFECVLSTDSFYPYWNIDGTDYTPVYIPAAYTYSSNSNEYYLTISTVQESMNNTCFYWFLQLYRDRVNSLPAKLIIPSLTNHTNLPVHVKVTDSQALLPSPSSSKRAHHVASTSELPTKERHSTQDNLHHIIVGISAGVAAVISFCLFIALVTTLICYFCKKTKAGQERNNTSPVYEEVLSGLAIDDNLQENMAYDILKPRIQINPAYEYVNPSATSSTSV